MDGKLGQGDPDGKHVDWEARDYSCVDAVPVNHKERVHVGDPQETGTGKLSYFVNQESNIFRSFLQK